MCTWTPVLWNADVHTHSYIYIYIYNYLYINIKDFYKTLWNDGSLWHWNLDAESKIEAGRISRWDRNLEHPRFLLILRVVYSGNPVLGLETHVFLLVRVLVDGLLYFNPNIGILILIHMFCSDVGPCWADVGPWLSLIESILGRLESMRGHFWALFLALKIT